MGIDDNFDYDSLSHAEPVLEQPMPGGESQAPAFGGGEQAGAPVSSAKVELPNAFQGYSDALGNRPSDPGRLRAWHAGTLWTMKLRGEYL